MTEITNHESPNHQSSPQPSLRPLWVSVLSGPVIYTLYFWAGYLLSEAACKADLLRFTVLGMDGLTAAESLLTLLAVGLTSLGFAPAWRIWRRTDRQASEENTVRFMAFGGLFLVAVFILTTLATGGIVIASQPCSWV